MATDVPQCAALVWLSRWCKSRAFFGSVKRAGECPAFFPKFMFFGDIKRKKLHNLQKKLLTGKLYTHFRAFTVRSVNNLMIYHENFSKKI